MSAEPSSRKPGRNPVVTRSRFSAASQGARSALEPLRGFARSLAAKRDIPRLRREERRLHDAIAASPGDPALRQQLATVLLRRGRIDAATDALFEAAAVGAPFDQLIWDLGRGGLGDHLSADQVDRLSQFAADESDQPAAQRRLGAFLLDIGDLQRGRSVLREYYRSQLGDRAPELLPCLEEDAPSFPPAFMLLGPHKSGTTSLFSLIEQHPNVLPAPRKELRFWTRFPGRSVDFYNAYFPPFPPDSGFIGGDGSPENLAVPEAAAAAARYNPNVKTIVLHRDPVARAYSHFQMHRRGGSEKRTFEQAIERELRILGDKPPLSVEDLPREHAPYLVRGCLLPFLRFWVDAVGASNVMVVESARLAADRDVTLDALFEYLGLPPAVIPTQPDRMVGSYETIASDTASWLQDWFDPHEAALDAFLATHPTYIP